MLQFNIQYHFMHTSYKIYGYFEFQFFSYHLSSVVHSATLKCNRTHCLQTIQILIFSILTQRCINATLRCLFITQIVSVNIHCLLHVRIYTFWTFCTQLHIRTQFHMGFILFFETTMWTTYYCCRGIIWHLWNIPKIKSNTRNKSNAKTSFMSKWVVGLLENYNSLARWSSGSAFACRSRCPWFESYTGLTWIFQGTRNESPRLHSTKVWIGTLRRLCLCKLDIPGRHNVGCTHNREWKFPKGDQNASFLMLPNDQVKLNAKGWLHGWIAESGPTKTDYFNFYNYEINYYTFVCPILLIRRWTLNLWLIMSNTIL